MDFYLPQTFNGDTDATTPCLHSPAPRRLSRRKCRHGPVHAGRNGWTNKPVRMLVPAPAGGTMDVIARLLADQLSQDLGQPVVVDNKPGAGGGIAISAMLAAPPDGQTIMVTATNVLTEVPHVLKTPYNTMKDIRPVAAVARSRLLLVARHLPAKDLKSLVSYVHANPRQAELCLLQRRHRIPLCRRDHEPEGRHGPCARPLCRFLAGAGPGDGRPDRADVRRMVTSLPMLKAGKLQAYAVASKSRSPLLPQVPTFAELGYPDVEFSNWVGVIASARVPAELAQKIQAAAYKARPRPRYRNGCRP